MNIVYTKGHSIEKINKWEEQINIYLEKPQSSSNFLQQWSLIWENLNPFYMVRELLVPLQPRFAFYVSSLFR